MKTVKYVPQVAEGEEKTFDGYIELSLINFEQKLEYAEAMGVEPGAESKASNMSTLRKMVVLAQKHYVSVALKNIKSGEEYKSYEDLSYDGDCEKLIVDVASHLFSRIKPVGNV